MTDASSSAETHRFQAETRQLLHLVVHALYSNRDIFLRELISNASDACDKLRFEALSRPELLADDRLCIRIETDADAGRIRIVDNGIGMSRAELIDDLGTIARSGTAEFLSRLTGDARRDSQLIGQFGVGFYSAFIVADRVEVVSRRAGEPGDSGTRWSSDGSGEFTVEPAPDAGRGTAVILHLKEDAREYARPGRIETLVRHYSDHIAFPVHLDDREQPINSAEALWTRPKSEIGDEEYREFYRHVAHDVEAPLAWSHHRVEGRREYTALLYVPARAPWDLWQREAPRGVKLYVQRVFIMDDAGEFLPLYLRFVRGVLDAADLSLNVSRELLQRDDQVQAIKKALTRRVLDMLERLATDEPERYLAFWREFGTVLKEGLAEDPDNRERIAGLLRFDSTAAAPDGEPVSLAGYLERRVEGQERIYYLTADSASAARGSPHLEVFRQRGIEVLLLTDPIDEWAMQFLPEFDGVAFENVARDEIELPGADAKEQDAERETGEPERALLERIAGVLGDRVEAVRAGSRLVDSAACLVLAAHDPGRRLRELLEAAGQNAPDVRPVLEINVSHPLVARLSGTEDETRFEDLARLLYDEAVLVEGRPLDDAAAFVRRVNRLLADEASA